MNLVLGMSQSNFVSNLHLRFPFRIVQHFVSSLASPYCIHEFPIRARHLHCIAQLAVSTFYDVCAIIPFLSTNNLSAYVIAIQPYRRSDAVGVHKQIMTDITLTHFKRCFIKILFENKFLLKYTVNEVLKTFKQIEIS